jgi:hypothetical protein
MKTRLAGIAVAAPLLLSFKHSLHIESISNYINRIKGNAYS